MPISRLPEPETLHFGPGVAHGCETVGRAAEIVLHELVHVGPHDLVSVDENDFVEVKGEEDVEEKNFVGPDNALFFFLCSEP